MDTLEGLPIFHKLLEDPLGFLVEIDIDWSHMEALVTRSWDYLLEAFGMIPKVISDASAIARVMEFELSRGLMLAA